MPGRKRTFRRRRPLRRYRRAARRIPRHRGPQRIFNFKQFVSGDNISGGLASRTITQGPGIQHFGWYFTLSDMPQYTTYTNLFDQYKINKIVIKFIPMIDSNGTQPVAGASLSNPGLMGTVIDYDDTNVLATIAAYEQYTNFKYQAAISKRTHTRVIRPRIAVAAYQSSFTGYANQRSQWIDCNSPSVQHYGIKFYMDAYANSNAAQAYQVMATYYVSFRAVR